MPALSLLEWLLAMVAAFGIGLSKSGLAGVSLMHVVIFAFLFGARDSTGVVLPMLIVGDLCAVAAYRDHVRWDYVARMLPPALLGVLIGWGVMFALGDPGKATSPQGTHFDIYKPVIGGIILSLTAIQLARLWKPAWFEKIPHALWFAWSLGLLAGVTTMLANAAGPIMALYFLAVALPKQEFVGTSAWFFLIVNALKIPFSVQLGLIHGSTLLLNALLVPMIFLGLLAGRSLVRHIPQKVFDTLLLIFTTLAGLKLLGVF
jgi:uncharacterized protein